APPRTGRSEQRTSKFRPPGSRWSGLTKPASGGQAAPPPGSRWSGLTSRRWFGRLAAIGPSALRSTRSTLGRVSVSKFEVRSDQLPPVVPHAITHDRLAVGGDVDAKLHRLRVGLHEVV